MICVLNFASDGYEAARSLNTRSAYKYGADIVYEYTLNDIDEAFFEKNRKIFNELRGCGYWLWKPYFISLTLDKADENDWVVYSDSGMFYRQSLKEYVDDLEKKNIYLISRATKFLEKQYTKRDVFIELGCDNEKYTDTLQRAASVIVVKNIADNRKIIKEWLELAQNYHLITDEPNNNGKTNYSEFIDHRHDQSLFSMVCKKHDVDYNNDIFLDFMYPFKGKALLIDHHSKYGTLFPIFISSVVRVFKILYGDFIRKCKK